MPPKFRRGRNVAAPVGAATTRNQTGGLEVDEEDASVMTAKRFAEISRRAELDIQMGFPSMVSGTRMGWMINMQPVRMRFCMSHRSFIISLRPT